MKFHNFLNEKPEYYGAGITFIDIDETTFRTFAKILVKKGGKVVRELDNQEFNSDVLGDGESYDFGQFKDAAMFKRTSIPIPQTINRIKRMLQGIGSSESNSRIVFLTARGDFDDKRKFLSVFERHGIKMSDTSKVYVERVGNMSSGTVDERKKEVMLKYLKSGLYRRVRLIDDHLPNLKALADIENNLPQDIEDKVRKTYNLDNTSDKLPTIQFFALHVQQDGSLKKVN